MTFYKVTNRSAGMVGYKVPDLGIPAREFVPGETKRISGEELEKLCAQPGGVQILSNYLQIEKEGLNALGADVEPEYFYTDDQIIDLMQTGSLDAFLDCLDFAPIGVLDVIKKYAVELPLNDYNKRRAIKDKLGFDVDAAIANLDAIKADEESAEVEDKPQGRRVKVQPVDEAVKPTTAPATATRRYAVK